MPTEPVGPEVVERHPYKGLVIEIEVYKASDGSYHTWPYIERSHDGATTKIHFLPAENDFTTKGASVAAAIKEGQRRIDEELGKSG
jgi:hypothetical protein